MMFPMFFVKFVGWSEHKHIREMNKVIDSADLKQFEKLLDESSRIVLTCHVRPDGDAVGSTLGLYHLL